MSWPQLGRDNVLEHYWFQFLIGNVLACLVVVKTYVYQNEVSIPYRQCLGGDIITQGWMEDGNGFQFLIGNVLAMFARDVCLSVVASFNSL